MIDLGGEPYCPGAWDLIFRYNQPFLMQANNTPRTAAAGIGTGKDTPGMILLVAVTCACMCLILAKCLHSIGPTTLWDFRSYYFSILAYTKGLNPYNFAEVNTVIPAGIPPIERGLTYPYHSLTFLVFRLLVTIPFDQASLLYVLLNAVALAVLIVLWAGMGITITGRNTSYFIPSLFLCPGMPLSVIFVSGNTAIFEALLVTLGLFLWLRARRTLSILIFCLAALFKLTSAANVLLLIALRTMSWRQAAFAVIALLATAAIFLTPCLVPASQHADLLRYLNEVKVENLYNHSSFMLAIDIARWLGDVSWGTYIWVLWLAAVGVVVGLRFLQTPALVFDLSTVPFFLLTVAVTTPRLRPYGFLVLVPALYLIGRKYPWLYWSTLVYGIALHAFASGLLADRGLFLVVLLNWLASIKAILPSNQRT